MWAILHCVRPHRVCMLALLTECRFFETARLWSLARNLLRGFGGIGWGVHHHLAAQWSLFPEEDDADNIRRDLR